MDKQPLEDNRFTSEGTMDLDTFMDALHKMLNRVWGIEWGVFSDESPTGNDIENTPLPHVTYNLASRKIDTDKGGIKAKQFGSFPDPDHEGHNITLFKQWFNCTVDFVVYAARRREAAVIAERLEVFIESYRGYFKELGISEITFQEEFSPGVSSQYRQDLPHRTVRYLVRIERINAVRSVHLKEIEHIVKVEKSSVPERVEREEPKSKQKIVENGLTNFLDLVDEHYPK